MAAMRQLEFFLLRYVPDAVKNEFVNIGLVMLEPAANGAGFADVRFTHDWRRVRCLDPGADVEMLEALERDIRARLTEVQDREALLHKLEDSFSNMIQLSPAKGCLAAEPSRELDLMAKMYLEVQHAGPGAMSGRGMILRRMEEAFEQANVLSMLLRDVPVAEYTQAGDPLRFDFGYLLEREIRFLQAVSLAGSVGPAVMLAARFPQIAAQIRKKDEQRQTVARMTAVVDDDLDRTHDEVRFAWDMMNENGIDVFTAAEMPRIAEEIRQALHA
jgi:hypothetical protein